MTLPSLGAPLALVTLLALGACASGPVDVQTAEAIPLRLDRSDPEPLLRSVLGGYAAEGGADAFDSGLVVRDGGGLALNPQRLSPGVREQLVDANGDGAIDWDELAAFLDATYYDAHGLPETLAEVRRQAPYAPGDTAWVDVEVDGVMTAARRRVFVPRQALREAMGAFASTGALRYPTGTWIVGEHLVEGSVVETTAKRRRADGFWDFAVYGPDGALVPATQTEPRPLRAPTQCTGCHLGQKLYEPEKSFPAAASDGPFGPRTYHVAEAARSREATVLFNEHARRDDGVLGLYATVYAGRLLAARAAGTLDPADAVLLDRLGL